MMISKWWHGGLQKALHTSRLYHTIEATPREFTGKNIAAKERAQGRIPGIVLAQDDVANTLSRRHVITADMDHIRSLFKLVPLPFFCSTIFNLRILAGSGSSTVLESGNVLPIKVHRDSDTGKVFNLVFVWAEKGSRLKVDVPVVFKGEDVCPGIRKGGYINKMRDNLKYLCPSEHIPAKVEVDLSTLDIGERVSMHDVQVHPSLKLLSKNEALPVCKITATH
ncbi:Ribosomal protein L25/Gln-tRNA synthetase, anti-codon-binding domain-containing protein [Heracleum sosnowskyi]|uniref:Ribosomal protein L25/Gln-tRNA synthetase, anti-codon-binding domain-containing protein n=1 Tax=Heracleum sosnowskyi TaxID=360622 RepID=A0AAD8M3Z6_9APIA|nr:Ribosomal protein L25/Gln-tRNA synthetase, anti-codon-binding domain-containing protein [Heracleum sosnowskyi]